MSTGILSPARRARAARRQMPSTRALVEGKVATGMKEVDEEGRDPGDKDKDMDALLGNKDKVQPPAVSQRGIVLAAIFYSACAATLLVFNKLAVRAVPSSSFNVAIQLLAAAVISRGLGIAGFVDCPGLQTKKVKKFLPVTILFTLCLYTNVKALSGTSVNTLIVTRASTPIFVAVMDVVFLRTGWPSLMTWSSLVAIFVGAYLYALTDDGFSPGSYFWLGIYLVSLCTEMVYVKHIVDSVEMTTWERVYYNNLLGLPCSVLFGVAMNEFSSVKAEMFTSGTCYLILLTCFVSVAISFAGFNARKVMSATSFTVLGVANKAGSVILSALLIAAKVQPISYVCLFLCIFASTLFSQSKSTTPPMQCGRGSVVEEEDSLSEDEVRAKRKTRLINLWLNALLLAYTGFTIYTALPIIFPNGPIGGGFGGGRKRL